MDWLVWSYFPDASAAASAFAFFAAVLKKSGQLTAGVNDIPMNITGK